MTEQTFQHRFSTLALIGVAIALGWAILNPQAGRREVRPFAFPADIPLSGWRLQNSQALTFREPEVKHVNVPIAGRRFHYQAIAAPSFPLEVKAVYVVGTLAEVRGLVKQLGNIELKGNTTWTVQESEAGHYAWFVQADRTYLTSCLNPRGGNTVTSEEFLHNRHTLDFQPQRLAWVLLGQEGLRDRRCLWIQISTPIQGLDPEVTRQRLKSFWLPWQAWWRDRFPQS
jgi:cyanosortase A-associated protein